jgi:nitroreductase
MLRKIFEAGSSAPSGGSIQRWLFLVIRDPDIEIGSHRSRALTAIAIERQDVKGMAWTHAQAWFCAPTLSAILAVRATLLGERGCKLSIPMAWIVSRYNQPVRQVGFEDESPWWTLRLQRRAC